MQEEIKRDPGRPPKCVNATPTTPDEPCCTEAKEVEPAELSKEQLLNLYNNKMEQYQKIIQSYQAREQELQKTLKQATLEYNARVQYLLDCAKHSYISMQFAVNATNTVGKE